ncbi:hypothetical protein PV458_32460 [Streptomyces sp. MN03-5084-2B]|nr:hypothetical protein [Streptomyces sp. MN03-5084-2B]
MAAHRGRSAEARSPAPWRLPARLFAPAVFAGLCGSAAVVLYPALVSLG